MGNNPQDLSDAGLAESLLQQCLTPEEYESLMSIRHELSDCIRWGKVVDEALPPILDSIEHIIMNAGDTAKRIPFEALFDRDQDFLYGDDPKVELRKKFVFYKLTLKLLGALKTRINQEMDKIVLLDDEEAGELEALLAPEPDEEEMDLVEGTEDTKDLRQGREIRASIISGGDVNCSHVRTTMKMVKSGQTDSGKDEIRVYCKDCRRTIRRDILGTTTSKRGSSRGTGGFWQRQRERLADLPCRHPKATWKEGEEGKTALCTSCGEPHPNPERLDWTSVGLEPYGDNPDEDEFEIIPARKQEVVAE